MISRAHALQPSSAEATEHDVPISGTSRSARYSLTNVDLR